MAWRVGSRHDRSTKRRPVLRLSFSVCRVTTMSAMRIVDFHNHYYPPAYVRALETASTVKVTYDAEGNPCVHYPGDYNILVPGHRDIAYRQRVLDEQGVTTQVLS